jgi:serine/threonine-protein kinase
VSPERIGGRASDPRDDVYGFGRALEDVLAASNVADDRLRRVAVACVGPDEARPPDGARLVELLQD